MDTKVASMSWVLQIMLPWTQGRCIYIYIYIHTHIYTCIYIYIYSNYCLCFQKTYSTSVPRSDAEQGPLGLLGTESFCVPRFFDYRKLPSSALHYLPWVPVGRLKQLLIREGREYEIREKQSQEWSWSKIVFLQKQIHITISLSYFADTETPSKWEKLMISSGLLPRSM